MFLESTYNPSQLAQFESLTIYDVAILTAHIGNKPFLKQKALDSLTSGKIQLVCFFAQGAHIVRTGRSLFKDDFYIVDNRIENPKIKDLFGEYDTIVTPFVMKEEIKSLLTHPNRGFKTSTNILCQNIAYEIIPQDYKAVMKELRETEPFKNALKDPFKKISKMDIKKYFEEQIFKPEPFNHITIGV